MGLTYESLHGGEAPARVSSLRYLVRSRCRPLVELAAVSYATDKGNGPAVYEHRFESYTDDAGEKRGPYLLSADAEGDFAAGDPIDEAIALGVLVDCETVDGEVVVVGPQPIWLATDPKGVRLLLCAPEGLVYAVEDRPGTFGVADEGIVG